MYFTTLFKNWNKYRWFKSEFIIMIISTINNNKKISCPEFQSSSSLPGQCEKWLKKEKKLTLRNWSKSQGHKPFILGAVWPEGKPGVPRPEKHTDLGISKTIRGLTL